MRIVLALGGHALLPQIESMNVDIQRKNIRAVARQIAKIAENNELVIIHGNGPQIGLLALQNPTASLDVLGAQTQGMLGYILQQELKNQLPEQAIVTVVTQTIIDHQDKALSEATKPIGPLYTEAQAQLLIEQHHWKMIAVAEKFRRVVPSPKTKKIVEIDTIKYLLNNKTIVICAGGGGIPTYHDQHNQLVGIEAVIDKDSSASWLAQSLNADMFIIAMDMDAICLHWGTKDQTKIKQAHPDALAELNFAAGSMRPKIQAAIEYVRATGKKAVIGGLLDLLEMFQGTKGSLICQDCVGIVPSTPTHQLNNNSCILINSKE
jgi:carbamate kinase